MLLWPHEAKIEPKLLLFVFFSASSKIASRKNINFTHTFVGSGKKKCVDH